MANKYHQEMARQAEQRANLRARGVKNLASRPSQTAEVFNRDVRNFLRKTK
jgi:hypothetical protein